MKHVGVEVLTIPLGTTKAYALRGDRVVLVDAGNPGNEGRILKRLEAAGIAPDQVSLILLTHGHVDHFGAAAALKEATGAVVAVHPADAEALRQGSNPPVHPFGATGRWLKRLMGWHIQGSGPPVEPDVLLEGETDLREFGVEARVIPTPGHTPGSISVSLPGGPVLVGDLIFGGMFRPRRPGWPWFADDPDQVRASIQRVLDLAPSTILAAHGGPFAPPTVRRRLKPEAA